MRTLKFTSLTMTVVRERKYAISEASVAMKFN